MDALAANRGSLLREIESKLGDNNKELYSRLAGIDGFSEKMISQNLVATRSKKFEDIMDEFKILLRSSENGTELLNRYETFIKVLNECENAHSIIPNLRVPEKKIKSYFSKLVQQEHGGISSRSDIDLTKESEGGNEIKLYFKNGLQEIVLLRDERFTLKKVLTLKEIKNIILSETIPCSFFLATFFSLPFSQKSTLISQFLQRVTYTIPGSLNPSTLIEYNARGVSINSRILLKHQQSKEYLWFAPAQILREALSCGSAILHMSIFYDYKLRIDFDKKPEDGFGEKVLDDYFDRVSQNVKQIVQYGHELQQMLSSRTIHLNILNNYGTNKGVVEFLKLTSRHLSNNSGFICLTISETEELSGFRHAGKNYDSKMSCIVHYAIQMHSEVPITFIVICSEKDQKNDREKAKQKLFEVVKIETARLGLQTVQASTCILVIDPLSSEDFKKLKSILDNEIKKQCFIKRDVKLSWLFLLNALLFSDKIVISYDDFKTMAGKLEIKEMESIEFLDTFTKSMSILYLPSFVKDVVILRPVEFINQLSTLFKIPYGNEDSNGVYTMKQLSKNKELAIIIADTLSSLGLALKTTSDKVDKRISALSGQPSTLLYIPLARSGKILEKSFTTSLYIIFDSKLTLPNFLSFFASELLNLRGFSLLTRGDDNKCHPNVLRVLLITPLGHEYIFFLVFHGIHVEVVIDSYREFGLSNVLEKILFCCQVALSKISSIVTEFSFKLALQCLRPDQVHTSKRIFEYLPKKQLCHQCETTVSVVRRKWKETIQKIHEDEEKRRDKIKTDEILVYAHNLGAHITSSAALKNFAVQLGLRLKIDFLTTISQSYSPWQRVFMVLLLLEKKEGAVKKETIKDALQRLGHPEFLT